MFKNILTLATASLLALFSSSSMAEMDLLGLNEAQPVRLQSERAADLIQHNSPGLAATGVGRDVRISGVDPRLKSASEEIEAFLSRLPHIIWAQIEAIRKYGLAAMFADESPMIDGAREAGVHLGRGIGQIAQAVAQDMARTARNN